MTEYRFHRAAASNTVPGQIDLLFAVGARGTVKSAPLTRLGALMLIKELSSALASDEYVRSREEKCHD